jgi:type IV pilus assembly protein PilE
MGKNQLETDQSLGTRMQTASKGFTLIELLVTVAIIGIISAVAIPQYSEYVRRSAREEAKGEMLNIAQMQERFFTNNNTYLAIAAPPAPAPNGWKNFSGNNRASAKYNIAVAAMGGGGNNIQNSYVITASPANGFIDPKCGNLSLTSQGVKSSTINNGAPPCW